MEAAALNAVAAQARPEFPDCRKEFTMSMEARLVSGLILSSVGLGYFVYGKKQQQVIPMLAGISLCVFPYFVSALSATVILGLVLAIIPWLIKF